LVLILYFCIYFCHSALIDFSPDVHPRVFDHILLYFFILFVLLSFSRQKKNVYFFLLSLSVTFSFIFFYR